MKISYAIPVCNEHVEIQRLVSFLLKYKEHTDEIVIFFDSNNGSKSVEEYLRSHSVNGEFTWHPYPFDGHFGNMKNKLSEMCDGDYIFQIDADELPDIGLMENIHSILNMNDVDVVLVPRVNTVAGLTESHIYKWKWQVNDNGWVNWPDLQWRIYRNSDDIKWENKVHEVLSGYKIISHLPLTEELALHHPKTIERQEKQNAYYDTL